MRRFSIALVVVGVLGAASAPGAAASGWSIQHTPNPAGAKGSDLDSGSCSSKSACLAVGYYDNGTTDVTLAERWNGNKWSIQKPPNPTGATNSYFNAVACTSTSACTGVGYYDNGVSYVTLAERWNGTKWSIQHTPQPAGSMGTGFYGVSCASASACTAVGYYETATTTVALAERWNGSKWSIQKPPTPSGGTDSDLQGVSCASPSACTAVGDYKHGTTEVTLAERWNGTKWSRQHTPNPTGTTESGFNGVSCASKSACTAVGSYDNGTTDVPLAERWNGTKWSRQRTANPIGAKYIELSGVSCTSASACTAVGSYRADEVTLAERWNGTKWSRQHTPNPTAGMYNELMSVSCTSTSACTAVGGYNNGTDGVTLAERWRGG